MEQEVALSVIIPTLNEGENICGLVEGVKRQVKKITPYAEIIVVDGNSKDNTREVARKSGAKVVVQKSPGYGGALVEGFNTAKGEFIVTMDADFSHDPSFIYRLWMNRDSADMVIASRYVRGGIACMPLFRKILSVILNKVFTFILSLPFRDISSGFRLYRKKAIDEIEIKEVQFDVLEEIIIKLYANGWDIKEVPFLYKNRRYGTTNARLIQFAIAYSLTIIKMWRLRNSIYYANYDEHAFNSRIPLQRYWHRKRFYSVMEMGGDLDNSLDVGCGYSVVTKNIPDIVCLDLDIKAYARQFKKTNRFIVKGERGDFPFDENSFDTVFCLNTLEYIDEKEELLKEIARVIKPGGSLILVTPDYGSKAWIYMESVRDMLLGRKRLISEQRRLDFNKVNEILRSVDFKIVQKEFILNSEMIIKAVKT